MQSNFSIWTGHIFHTFPASDLDLTHMTMCQNQDIPSGQKQSLYEVRIFYDKRDMDRIQILHRQKDKVVPIYPSKMLPSLNSTITISV